MLTEVEKVSLLELAKSRGYEGYSRQGKYCFSGGFSSKAIPAIKKALGLPDTLLESDLIRVYREYKSEEFYIFEFLKEFKQSDNGPRLSQTIGNMSEIEEAYKDLEVYKSIVIGVGPVDPYKAKSNGFSVILFNKETREILDLTQIDPEPILFYKGIDRTDVAHRKDIPLVIPKFNPLTPDLIFHDLDKTSGGSRVLPHLNTALPPFWMRGGYEHCEPKMGSFVSRLINHLFPRENEREHVLDWCHYALTSIKNETNLCLAGDRGTGKNTFTDILAEVIGVQYREIVSESILTDKFNGQLYNKRLIVFDEVGLEEKKHVEKVKRWSNREISIERKGQDSFTAPNYTSMIFMLNDISNLKIESQDRRFSAPSMATEPLHKAISPIEINRFKNVTEDYEKEYKEEIASFGKFLMERVPKTKITEPIKNEYYHLIADMAMKEWQHTLREYVLNNGIIDTPIPINKIFPNMGPESTAPKKKSSYTAFLSDYRYLGEDKIGTAIDFNPPAQSNPLGRDTGRSGKKNFAIMPNKNFLLKYGTKYKSEDLL